MSRVQLFLADLRDQGTSIQTSNHYLRAIKQLTRWMVKDRRAHDEPLQFVLDAQCEYGSGRMLLAVAEINPHWESHGQDVNLRCVRLTALNLAFLNVYGYVICWNSLGNETKLIS